MKLYNTLTRKVEEFVPREKTWLGCTRVVLPFTIMLTLVI